MILKTGRRTAVLAVAVLWGSLSGCASKAAVEHDTPLQAMATAEVESDGQGDTDNAATARVNQPSDHTGDPSGSKPTVAPPSIPQGEPSPLIHKVRWGHETLYTIALWYTGKGYNWRRIAAANPGIKPRRIRIGDTIRIPDGLLTTRRPMPQDYLKPRPARNREPAPQVPPETGEPVQPPPLYGPVVDEPSAPDSGNKDLPVPLETIDE